MRTVLSSSLQRRLDELSGQMKRRRTSRAVLDEIVSELATLSPQSAGDIAKEIQHRLGLYRDTGWYPRCSFWPWRRRVYDRDLLAAEPRLAFLYIFHGDGHVREAALLAIDGPLAGPLFIAALMLRLNDWVPQVRNAARVCIARVIPQCDPHMAAAAGLTLLRQSRYWRRWVGESDLMTSALASPPIAAALADAFRTAREGPVAPLLLQVLKEPALDGHLPRMAVDAFLPAVRSVALRVLIAGKVLWQSGYERQRIGYSDVRYVPAVGERAIPRPASLEALMRQAATDRSAQVRKAAAIGLVDFRDSLSNVDEIIALLAKDKSRAIRERVDFVRRKRTASAGDPPGT